MKNEMFFEKQMNNLELVLKQSMNQYLSPIIGHTSELTFSNQEILKQLKKASTGINTALSNFRNSSATTMELYHSKDEIIREVAHISSHLQNFLQHSQLEWVRFDFVQSGGWR